MKVFAISDLHLSFGSDKPMDIFGAHWEGHPERLREAWSSTVTSDDIVLIPGDISWAMKLPEAAADLSFVHGLPGTKVIIKGNHDYWWASMSKVRQALPPSILPLQNTAVSFGDVGVAGSRLWIDPDLRLEEATPEDRKIFHRELGRFSLSLKELPQDVRVRIVMTHFPPISLDGRTGKAVETASGFGCDIWIFGHMHLGTVDYSGFNRTIGGTRFEFVSADYLDFRPRLIYDADKPAT
ncbi:MAG TPA: metallophosphoesterase [Deltaproteobacteria bacterium]|nr:metallophosphoesterase [Deltaproteobacteria bacterium]HPR56409.1 metallophosphoesterase [Deltaproteobacteria bacterium]HXK48278.1 metallophosphoesterase [Deltaproteobacteria bacterium]